MHVPYLQKTHIHTKMNYSFILNLFDINVRGYTNSTY